MKIAMLFRRVRPGQWRLVQFLVAVALSSFATGMVLCLIAIRPRALLVVAFWVVMTALNAIILGWLSGCAQRTIRHRLRVIEEELERRAEEYATLNAEMRRLDLMKSAFLATAAHELRTPLTSLQGFSEILLIRGDLSEEQRRKCLTYINQQAIHLATIVDDLLDVSRIESGEALKLRYDVVDLFSVVEEVVTAFRISAPTHHFVVEGPGTLALVWGDAERLYQVMQHLVSNAVKYSPVGSTVTIRLESTDDSLKTSVSDQGIGMTREELAHAFEKFYRADLSNLAPEGMGLGLFMARHIVEAHGGEISIESTPGVGTTVYVVLPRYKKPGNYSGSWHLCLSR